MNKYPNKRTHPKFSNKLLIAKITSLTSIPRQDVREVTMALVSALGGILSNHGKLNLHGVGSFAVKPRSGRWYVVGPKSKVYLHKNKVGDKVWIPASYCIKFKASPKLRSLLGRPSKEKVEANNKKAICPARYQNS